MPALLDVAALVTVAAAVAGTGLGLGFIVKGGAWTPPRPVAWGHGLLGLGAIALAIAVVAAGAPTRVEPEGGVSFGVLALALLLIAASLGVAGDRTPPARSGLRGFVLSAHALFAVFGTALAITAALTAAA